VVPILYLAYTVHSPATMVSRDEEPRPGTVVAESWRHLDDLLFEGAWNPQLRRFRSQFAFRGDSRRGRPLETGLMRLGGNLAAKERHLVRNFRKYARRTFVGDDSVWNWLALAQHHGMPTRMIDWSYSPYVALHFATCRAPRMGEDGEVWMVDLGRVHRALPEALRDLLRAEGSYVFTGELLSAAARSPEDLSRLSPDSFVAFLEPPSLDDWIVNQAALFSLMSTPDGLMDRWLAERPEAWRRVVIPGELKWEVRDRLDQVNLTDRVLFPGMDGLSAWLARYYQER
jgi:hypothetical protein